MQFYIKMHVFLFNVKNSQNKKKVQTEKNENYWKKVSVVFGECIVLLLEKVLSSIKKGYKLSEYGLFNRKTGELVAAKTEKEIFKKLGVPYVHYKKRDWLSIWFNNDFKTVIAFTC